MLVLYHRVVADVLGVIWCTGILTGTGSDSRGNHRGARLLCVSPLPGVAPFLDCYCVGYVCDDLFFRAGKRRFVCLRAHFGESEVGAVRWVPQACFSLRERVKTPEETDSVCGDVDPFASSLCCVRACGRDEFKTLDYQRIYDNMAKPAFVFDGRSVVDIDALRAIGFEVYCIGKSKPKFTLDK